MSERSNTGETPDTDPRGDDDPDVPRQVKLRLPVVIDEPRTMMFDELVEQVGDEETVEAMIGENIKQSVHGTITALYDNRDQVSQIREQIESDGQVEET